MDCEGRSQGEVSLMTDADLSVVLHKRLPIAVGLDSAWQRLNKLVDDTISRRGSRPCLKMFSCISLDLQIYKKKGLLTRIGQVRQDDHPMA